MILLVAQARMQSTCLPGKVLKEINGISLLEYHVGRLRRSQLIDKLVIATSELPADDPIAQECERLGVTCIRGSEADVLDRYRKAVEATPEAEMVIRTTCDCPLIDPGLVDQLITQFQATQGDGIRYMNITSPDFPRGLDAEIFYTSDLLDAANAAKRDFEREHVTPFIRENQPMRSMLPEEQDCDFALVCRRAS